VLVSSRVLVVKSVVGGFVYEGLVQDDTVLVNSY
jgi:hypothetical protein